MKKPITHSEFTKFIIGATIDGNPLPSAFTREIISLTAGGVAPEAGLWPTDESNVVFHEGAPKPKYRLGRKSLAEGEGVHPGLMKVVNRAIELTEQDFTLHDGLRTAAEQARLKAIGASKTLDSYHLRQDDGYGHAVDLVPYVGGVLKWDWDGCYKIAWAMDQAATEQGVAHMITWGGAWDRNLSDFGGSEIAYREEVEKYKNRHAGKDFIDGPHFQWRR